MAPRRKSQATPDDGAATALSVDQDVFADYPPDPVAADDVDAADDSRPPVVRGRPGRQRLFGPVALIVAVALALGAGAVGYAVVDRRAPTYFATSATLLDEPIAIAASQDSGVLDKLSRLRFKYAGILRSDAIVDAVATTLAVDRGVVAGSIVSSGDTNSLLLFVGAQATTPDLAVRLANELARELALFISKEQANSAIPVNNRVTLSIVAPARAAKLVEPTSRQRDVAALGAGFGLLALTLGVAGLLRRRRV